MKEIVNKIKIGLNKTIQVIKAHKGISIGICCGIIAIIVAIGIAPSFSYKNNGETLSDSINGYGAKWYENNYYPGVMADEKLKENYLSKFKEIGIKVNMENLYRTVLDDSDESAKIKNGLEEKKCDLKESKVIIYPQSPYGLNDYRIEVKLECELE